MTLTIYDETTPLGKACRDAFEHSGIGGDVFICNPPAEYPGGLEAITGAEYLKNHEEGIKKPFFAAVAAARRMMERGGGRMLFVGTIHAEKPGGALLHSASMGALKNLCREAAVRWGQHGILCCFVETVPEHRSIFDTPLYKDMRFRAPAPCDFSPEAAARFLCMLATAPALINGAEIRLDGGLVQNYMDHSANYRKHLAGEGLK